MTRPGKVFTTDIPSAPASAAVRALAPMSCSVGDNLTKIGLRVACRAVVTTSVSERESAPNSRPPAFTFGQLTLSSYPDTAGESSSVDTTAANSSTWFPTTFTSTFARRRFPASHGRCSARTSFIPGFASPTALIMPPSNSATRGAGAPCRGSTLTAFVINPPNASMSITWDSSRP